MVAATGYDGLSADLVPAAELRGFLLECFGIAETDLFVGQVGQVDELESGPPFAAFCTWWPVTGHFAMGFDVGIEDRLAARVGRHEFAERFAAHFGTTVLYGDTEPPGLWTVVLADGTRLLASLSDAEDAYLLDAVSTPVPALPEVPVNEELRRHL